MSNKNIVLPKYKWEGSEPIKQASSPVAYKEDRKIYIQYSPKNMPTTQSPKYFKTAAINRHYS